MEELVAAIEQAAHDTAVHLTADLRQRANAAGWHPEVAANLHVSYDGNSFKAHVHPDYADAAHVLEYGSENTRPTAVLRKFSQETHNSSRVMAHNVHHHAGGLL